MCYLTCTTQMLCWINLEEDESQLLMRVRIWYFTVFSLDQSHFFILLFYLKQKHEEGQRFLHYLRQTNSSLATCINEISATQFRGKRSEVYFNVRNFRANKWVTCLGTLCNCGTFLVMVIICITEIQFLSSGIVWKGLTFVNTTKFTLTLN
jgi:hypothetical protein